MSKWEKKTATVSENKTTDESEGKEDKEKSFLMKWGGLIFIIAVIVTFIFLAVSNINFGQWLAYTALWFHDTLGWFGIYAGVFTISIFGNFTIIFPVPYSIAIIVVSVVIPDINPVLLGLAAGLGAAIGEVSAWLMGRGANELIGESESTKRFERYIEKGWAPALIYIFAATPLPDDAFLLVLGYTKYSIKKALFWCFLGKFTMCFLLSAIPTWIMNTNPDLGNFLLGLFGINLTKVQQLGAAAISASTPEELAKSTIMWIVMITVMFLFVYVDWGKLYRKYIKHEKAENGA